MSSFEDVDLFQMVNDFIESEPTLLSNIIIPCSNCSKFLPSNHQSTNFSSLQEIIESSRSEGEEKVLECVLKHMRSKKDETRMKKKWFVVWLRFDGFNASLCQSSWNTSIGCPGGEYEYIEVMMEDVENKEKEVIPMVKRRVIIDIDFKSQFEIARPTPTYKQLIDILPTIFVGNEDNLNRIIAILCSAAKQSFKESGLYIPPWRTTSYMQCKWCKSHNCHHCKSGTSKTKEALVVNVKPNVNYC